ncbi:hypothetical protein Bhyg_11176 [Pseudolycoriella hygida]|uniref:Uncharacterized protein n=1 Tax=Pseudolycoriella hygida TaxID=35572 RepID=A0A9Q0MUT1_9DIPT|nr:hypothetical protein Bhyg_11176 [Pseudolycoriella hygida]
MNGITLSSLPLRIPADYDVMRILVQFIANNLNPSLLNNRFIVLHNLMSSNRNVRQQQQI